MQKNTITKVVAAVTILVGITVIVGWMLDLTVLTSIMPQWIRMKFATATCFILSGGMLLIMSFGKQAMRESKKMLLAALAMLCILMMGTLFLGSIFGFQTGMENISFVDVHEVARPIFQGRPALPTMICFILISVAALLYGYRPESDRIVKKIGWIVCVIGWVGLLGYILNNHYLNYEIPPISNAIAIHTTILFGLLGIGLIRLEKDINTPSGTDV